MALLFIEGFGGGDQALLKWDVGSAVATPSTATPRLAGNYYGNAPGALNKTIPETTQAIVGLGFYSIASATSYVSFWGDSGATQHITVQRNTSGFIEIRRGSTSGTLLATGTTPIAASTWFYLEASVTISDTVGQVHVRLNGAPTDEVAYTGDTKNAGTNTTIDRVSLACTFGTYNVSDLYILDTTGTTNNSFLGDVAVRTLSPTANGTYSQLTNSAGNSTNNYTYVDEHPYSGTDYVGSQTTGLRDTYSLADLPAGVSTVYGLQIVGFMAKNDASFGQAKLAVLSGGSLRYGANHALSTSYQSYYDLFTTNPVTGISWSVSDVNGLEAGMEVA